MKTKDMLLASLGVAVLCLCGGVVPLWAAPSSGIVGADRPPIPLSVLGAEAAGQCQGDALTVTATADGTRLRCGFQQLEARATPEGLWLESVVPGGGRLRLVASAVSREQGLDEVSPFLWAGSDDAGISPWRLEPWGSGNPAERRHSSETKFAVLSRNAATGPLADSGTVELADDLVRFIRPGLTEEYSVSVDGVRQDFVIPKRRCGVGNLRVELALTGARAEAAVYGARLRLNDSSRELAYSGLRVTDITGRELAAHLEVLSSDRLAIHVADARAIYPVRIDPTFSDADWVNTLHPGMPGADNVVYAVAVGGNGEVYIGGDFTVVGTVAANRVAKWDGNSWSALGSGMNHTVKVLLVNGTNLYAGGSFTKADGVTVNRIAKWDGAGWSGVGPGFNGTVAALVFKDNDLYAGGAFTYAGSEIVYRIARWDGSSWSALGAGFIGALEEVRALAVYGTDLYAGGKFQFYTSGQLVRGLARWDGSAWLYTDNQFIITVNALAVSGTNLYVGEETDLARWDGTSWSRLEGSFIGGIHALAVRGTNLFVGGGFVIANGVMVNRIVKWNGDTWSNLGSGTVGTVYALAASESNLYVGGGFLTAGAVTVNCIARWDDSNWSALGGDEGVNRAVFALATDGTNLYAAGDNRAPDQYRNYQVTKWEEGAWSALGGGMNLGINALATDGTNVYAGGYFSQADGLAASRVAKWDGVAWSALGEGVSGSGGYVYALVLDGSHLYAAGAFTNAGGIEAKRIAQWDGHEWAAVGGGMSDTVYSLAMCDGRLYAGGSFTNAGGVAANRIAKWDGHTWSAVGGGMNDTVYALAIHGDHLYAGGSFTNASGVEANRIAKWDGTAWTALQAGMEAEVRALVVNGSDLYAGGSFTNAAGMTAHRIAKWDGNGWWPLGSGVAGVRTPTVHALLTDGRGRLFVGGDFSLAGDKVAPFIAQVNLIPARGMIQNIGVSEGAVVVDCLGLPGTAYAVERAQDVLFSASPMTLLVTNAPSPDGFFRCMDFYPPGTAVFYRLRRQ